MVRRDALLYNRMNVTVLHGTGGIPYFCFLGRHRGVIAGRWTHFPGLAHRCEFVASVAGVDFINDSNGTNTGASVAALVGLGQQQELVLIAGGVGRGANFEKLRTAINHRSAPWMELGGRDSELRRG